MRKYRGGFTLIEVSIFLAITGALFIGIVASMQISLSQQRDTDAVQDFMEFLRGVYSEVTNVQRPVSDDNGQSNQAIYGKMITFGEEFGLTGEVNTDHAIFAYTVVGRIAESGTGSTLELLGRLGANILASDGGGVGYIGLVESYIPKWQSEIQPACYDREDCFVPLKGTMLIVRHPMSGNVTTYYSDDVVEVNKGVRDNHLEVFGSNGIQGWTFAQEQIDFCVNTSSDLTKANTRFDVRIINGAHNASSVELVPEDSASGVAGGSNKCKGN